MKPLRYRIYQPQIKSKKWNSSIKDDGHQHGHRISQSLDRPLRDICPSIEKPRLSICV